ncbi:MAG: ribonuclease domain-containing protein [Coriobacteriales bacterium]|jgi:hypothetical protein
MTRAHLRRRGASPLSLFRALPLLAAAAIALLVTAALAGCAADSSPGAPGNVTGTTASGAVASPRDAPTADDEGDAGGAVAAQDGRYTSKDEVALYVHTYGRLPSNFITKAQARAEGWVPSEGNLAEVCPGMSIGGDEFYNDEGALPDAEGRRWTECDVGYDGDRRGPERIVFSNDGLVYYTADHYRSWERLY